MDRPRSAAESLLTLFLCGDVMTGQGIDQALPHPGDPRLHEEFVKDARDYVRLAEAAHGPIPRPVQFPYIWGDSLEEPTRVGPDARVINLETGITRDDDHWPAKGIHYRMHPDNVPCLTAAGIDVCALANNHVMDSGHAGLHETLETLTRAGLRTAGAGRTLAEARAPAAGRDLRKGPASRLRVRGRNERHSLEPGRHGRPPGARLPARSLGGHGGRHPAEDPTGEAIPRHCYRLHSPGTATGAIRSLRPSSASPGGHSSHHVRPIEIYQYRLILYGCGDFVDDY